MKGFDEFNLDPGSDPDVVCRVCGKPCKFIGHMHGPRTFIDALAGKKRDFDYFKCEDKEELWHIQARAIIRQIEKTPSARLSEMMGDEVKELLETKTPTKGNFKRGY